MAGEPPRFSRISSSLGRGGPQVITISRASISSQDAEPALSRLRSGFSVPEEAAEAGRGGYREPLLNGQGGQEDEDAHSGPSSRGGDKSDDRAKEDVRMRIAINASLACNILLLVAKAFAYYWSHSKAVLASTADSFVDIASQVVIAFAEHRMQTSDPRFPVGQARAESVGVVACAVIMALSTIEVVQSSADDLYRAYAQGILPQLDMDLLMYIILGAATLIKVLLYFYCVALQHRSDSIMALAEDHRNDIMSNGVAILCGIGASQSRRLWWIDPVGGILVSLYIIYSWLLICKGQVDKLVGVTAPEDFLQRLESLAGSHHELLQIDVIRAYFFGSRFLVELEVVLPGHMSVHESHDIALQLQHKVENLDSVERAFVHVDYQTREEPEHKVDFNLRHHRDMMEPHDSLSQHGSAAADDALSHKQS